MAVPIAAGPFSGPTDTVNGPDPAIPGNSVDFVEWADAIDADRTSFAPRGSTSISTTGFNSLGDLDASEIDGGVTPGFLTVTFPTGIGNGDGADFAVFENGFVFPGDPNLFAELAYVEVSSNGNDFARFPSISTNTTFVGTFGQAFGGFDATNIYNLAGKHVNGLGTPFDLDDLLDHDNVTSGAIDLDNIQYVRLVDIPGNGSFLDSEGNPILDAWLTTGSGGFDFRLPAGQGIGVIHLAAPSDLPGDYDGDGFVSQADLNLVLLNWGDTTLPAGWLAADQFDGVAISQNELDGVLLNWGEGTPPSLTPIPEPTALSLIFIGVFGLSGRRSSPLFP
ncbi:MAG: PEP-CTERM sorting domain-containing protein [Planctomycetota bacterium]